nr:A24 family peptidase [Paenibacillus hamazuiensis]
MLGTAFFTDLKTMKIPNVLTVSGVGLGLLVHSFADGWNGLLYAFAGAAAGFGCLLLLYWMKALGAGDVKLFAAIGAIGGAGFALSCLMYSVVFAGGAALIIWLLQRKAHRLAQRLAVLAANLLMLRDLASWYEFAGAKDHIRFPFMLAVVPGAIAAAYLG